MITETERDNALTFMKTKAKEYAEAKSSRKYLESFTKTLRARLYNDCAEDGVKNKEMWADAHTDMETHLIGVKAAQDVETKLEWELKAAEVTCDHYRTDEASHRRMDRAAQ